jgi:aerobic-type carbon monoxide dehydrogenase small subunit (CoxS/CutS family)
MDISEDLDTSCDITVTINGQVVQRRVAARTNLVDFVRHDLELTGSHVGCEHGVCGACTILVDGVIVRGCLMLAVQADGATVDTIEGLTETGQLADLQQAFHEKNAAQCGFCSPGFLLTAHELLSVNANPSRDEIRAFISGNYCRCTGYQAIVDAIEHVATERHAAQAG